MENDPYKDYFDDVAVPFFPRKWLNKVTLGCVGVIILYFPFKGVMTKLTVEWGHLSNTWLGDIAVLTTVIFAGTFVAGRFLYWRAHKDIKIGEDNILDNVEGLLNPDENKTDTQIVEDMREMLDRYRARRRR